ncbi:hypothetical protein TNIN_429341 [Trichonephila inaurata madagascariensis]|uniref:Uncharacterized protein n=1 Tax=Trichonephila inaurata madagascariensis TaxID=2747483 RepID=A0A8X7BZS0_9ARAC|nr:hypothetical protein TNIN_429341 [Trichonephila inaurata madagascariensis]
MQKSCSKGKEVHCDVYDSTATPRLPTFEERSLDVAASTSGCNVSKLDLGLKASSILFWQTRDQNVNIEALFQKSNLFYGKVLFTWFSDIIIN